MYFDGSWPQAMPASYQAMLARLVALGYSLPPDFSDRFSQRQWEHISQREMEFVEYTALHQLRDLLAESGYPQASPAHLRQALDAMYAVTQPFWKLEADTLTALEDLRCRRCLRLGLVSNSGDTLEVRHLLHKLGLEAFFEQVLISAELGIRKPNPAIFQLALDFFKVPASQAVMVGDTLGADILGAQNAGIFSIWIPRRSLNRPDTLAHAGTILPNATITDLSELGSLLDKLSACP